MQKIVYRLKHSFLVNCYDLWSVVIFDVNLLAYCRLHLTYSRFLVFGHIYVSLYEGSIKALLSRPPRACCRIAQLPMFDH